MVGCEGLSRCTCVGGVVLRAFRKGRDRLSVSHAVERLRGEGRVWCRRDGVEGCAFVVFDYCVVIVVFRLTCFVVDKMEECTRSGWGVSYGWRGM